MKNATAELELAQSAANEAIRPFRVNIPEAELVELRRRITATRFPEKETVTDTSQGVPLDTVQALARYWASDYDWRKCEAKLSATAVHDHDRRAGHPLHPREVEATECTSGHHHARVARLDPRADQARRPAHQPHGLRRPRAEDAFYVAIPSIPGYGFSGKPTTELGTCPTDALASADERDDVAQRA